MGANLNIGDRLRAEAIDDGEVVFRRIASEHGGKAPVEEEF